MNPHVIVLEPGLVVLKIYTTTGVVADRPLRSFARLACGVEKIPSRLGHNDDRTEADWEKGEHGPFYSYGKTYGQLCQERE
jgi:hypothetical protein